MSQQTSDRAVYWSAKGLIEGARAMISVALGQFAFGVAFGILAAQTGFSLPEAIIFNSAIYAGLVQVVVVQNWPHDITLAALGTIALVTATVNSRFFLMGLTLRPWFGSLPAWQVYPMLPLMTDAGWLKAMQYHSTGGRNASYFLGGALLQYTSWCLAVVPGFLFATSIAQPRTFGLDLVVPCFFAALLIPGWRGFRPAIPWAISGAVAIAVGYLVHGYWFILAGALAGSISAGLLDDDR